tara:strand:- start:203 stop:1843 length:1641 start_codon:yes stop_codon:yes gene_type:complete
MKKDLDSLLSEHYSRDKAKRVGPEALCEMIQEVMDDIKKLQVITEAVETEVVPGEEMQLTVISPMIRLTEKGWGKEGSKDREILNNLLQRIISKGASLTEKIKLIDQFLNEPPREDVDAAEAMSHIVFLDTLTNILVHFGPSAAGFTFEGFLAALLEGEQVPAGTAGIQDIIDNEKSPISLKLLTETRGGDVEGSYVDLISHFTDPTKTSPFITDSETGEDIENPEYVGLAGVGGTMKYIIALKELKEIEGEGITEVEGTIRFYEFDFNAATFLEALVHGPSKNHLLLLLPNNLESDAEIQRDPAEEFNPLGAPESEEYINLEATSRKVYDTMVNDMTPEAAWELWQQAEMVSVGVWGGSGAKRGQPKLKIAQTGTDKVLYIPHSQIRGADPRFHKVAHKGMEGYRSYGESYALLKSALDKSEQAFWDLIGKTAGADVSGDQREETQFVVANRYYKKTYENGVGFIGKIEVGRDAVTALANKYVGVLQQKIFDIFGMLRELSNELNSYFVGGDKEAGLRAADKAGSIEAGTKEYHQQQKEKEAAQV